MASDLESVNLPPGAMQWQKNIQSNISGRLTVRGGLQPTDFSITNGGAQDVIGCYTYQVNSKDYVIYAAADMGTVTNDFKVMSAEGSNTPVAIVNAYFNTFTPVHFCKTRFNFLVMVNGLNRGKIWNGEDVTADGADELGIDAPTTQPTVAGDGDGAITGVYVCYYRYKDYNAEPILSSLSPVKEVTASSDLHFDWGDFVQSSQDRVKFVELWRSTAGQAIAVYLIATLGHNGSISTITNNGGKCRFLFPSDHNLIVGATIDVTGTGNGSYHVEHRVTVLNNALSVDTSVDYDTTDGSGGAWTLEGFDDTDTTIDTILRSTAITTPATVDRILSTDGSLNMNRFTPPPDYMSVAVQFQDRMFYGVPVSYDAGTITTISQPTTTVEGTSVSWDTDMAGSYISIAGEDRKHLIASVTDEDTLETTENVTTNHSAVAYTIEPPPTERRKWYFSEPDEPESVPTTNDTIVQENTGDDDDMTGGMPHGSYFYATFERHIYRMSFVRQPNIDAQWTLVASRGCFNQSSWDRYADIAFMMDQSGPYVLSMASPIPKVIGVEIQDLWKEDILDFSKSKWFFTKVDPVLQVARYYVVFKADVGISTGIVGHRPRRAICHHWPSGSWWVDEYPLELGGATTIAIAGKLRTVVGGEAERILLTNEGTTDIVTQAYTGTVASPTTTSINGTFPDAADDAIGSTIAIVAGTGAGQSRSVTDSTATVITVADWDTTPDTTSKYILGAIPYEFKTGEFRFAGEEDRSQRKIGLNFKPTQGASVLEVRHYLDDQAVPRFGTITSSAETGTDIEFTVPQNHGLVAGAKFRVDGSSEPSDNVLHTVVSVTATTVLTSTRHDDDGLLGYWELDSSELQEKHEQMPDKGDGLEIDPNTKQPIVDLQVTRSALGNQPGFCQIMFSGNVGEGTQAPQYITVEVAGFQGDDNIQIAVMELGGVG